MDVSVVVPLMNEEACLRELHRRITEALGQAGLAYEVIFVDDGSTDSTYEILRELKGADDHLRVIKFRRNFGQTAAMQAGFDRACGRVIVSMDGDLQNDPKDIPRLLAKLEEGYELVCGWRERRQDKLIARKVPSRVANWLIGRLTGIKIHDTGCSLKAFRHSALEKTRLYSDMHRFIPAMLSMAGVRYVEIPVAHHPRRFGKAKYGLSRIWKVFLDLLAIKAILSFASRPALCFGLLSLPCLGLGMLAAALSIASVEPAEAEGGTVIQSTVAFVFFALATHMFLLGILGELVRRFSPWRQIDLLDLSATEEWNLDGALPGGLRPGEGRVGT